MTPDPSTGQILPGSKFGDKLTELAREAKVIVEIGTWKGQGSTWCLQRGFHSTSQWLITVEADASRHFEARQRWQEWRMWCIWGTLVKPEEFPPYFYLPPEDRRDLYRYDKETNAFASYCLPIIPPEIDLLLLDGGEWTSNIDYEKLKDRSKVIALDDTHPKKSIKNYRARGDMLLRRWEVLADELDDRNGWFIARRP